MVNEHRNRFRKRRVAERLTDQRPERGEADATGRYDERLALIAALQRLGTRQRAVVMLRYWVGLTETEAAITLGCSVGTVSTAVRYVTVRLAGACKRATSEKWLITATGP